MKPAIAAYFDYTKFYFIHVDIKGRGRGCKARRILDLDPRWN